MWYKNAGFDVVGTCEIDPQMNAVYQTNFWKKINYEMWVQEMKNLDKINDVLFNLDILDWSPPCSTFSTAGQREKGRGVKKKFREWQAEQSLSDLFFDYLELADKLKPKFIVAENVKGMLAGNAKLYVKMIAKKFQDIWYSVQLFLLNGATMWLPQARERVFFIASRNDLWCPPLKLHFNEKPVTFQDISDESDKSNTLSDLYSVYRDKAKQGWSVWKFMSNRKIAYSRVANTIVSGGSIFHPKYKRELNVKEMSLIGSFPQDYKYLDCKPKYLIGMSVPPLMMYRIAKEIKTQWLDKLDTFI